MELPLIPQTGASQSHSIVKCSGSKFSHQISSCVPCLAQRFLPSHLLTAISSGFCWNCSQHSLHFYCHTEDLQPLVCMRYQISASYFLHQSSTQNAFFSLLSCTADLGKGVYVLSGRRSLSLGQPTHLRKQRLRSPVNSRVKKSLFR